MEVVGCRFLNPNAKNEGFDDTVIDIKQMVEFPRSPLKDVDEIIEKDEVQLNHLIKIEKAVQKRLPEMYQSKEKLNLLEQNLEII